MENLKSYLTGKGWKRDLDKTVEDTLNAYRVIIRETPEQTEAKQRANLMERIMGHIGLPKGVIHRMDSLYSYCNKNGLDILPVNDAISYCKEKNIGFTPIETENKDDICLLTKLGKAVYQLTYDSKGNFKGLVADFKVKTDGQPLII